MSLSFLTGILVVLAMDAEASGMDPMILNVKVEGNVPASFLNAGIMEAVGIFRKAGIRIIRRASGRREEFAEPVENIEVRVVETAPRDKRPAVLASSLPYAKSGVRVFVYYERVAGVTPMPNPIVLGYALAHEIGHVLLRMDTHSDEGVMKARWNTSDFSWMQAHMLRFSDDDAEMMRRNLGHLKGAADCLQSGGRPDDTPHRPCDKSQ